MSDDPTMAELREQISALDRQILDAVNTRLELVARLRRHKEENGIAFLDPGREEWLLQHLADALVNVKRQYFLAHGAEKESYRQTVLQLEKQLRDELHEEHGVGTVDWRIQFAEAFADKLKPQPEVLP